MIEVFFWLFLVAAMLIGVSYDAYRRGLCWPVWLIVVFIFGLLGILAYGVRVVADPEVGGWE